MPKSYLALGGGVNSTALLIEIIRRKEPLDAIVFADTGGERPETYAYLDVLSKWLASTGAPEIETVKHVAPITGDKTLEEEMLRLGNLPSKAYGGSTCSLKWKLEPQQKWLKRKGWELPCIAYVGFDAGESNRAEKLHTDEYTTGRAPLIEWGIDRDACVEIIAAAGLPVPPKSSCFFCPSMRKHEILSLKDNHPDLYERALEMERRAAPKLTTLKGLGRTWSWDDVEKIDGMFSPESCSHCIG